MRREEKRKRDHSSTDDVSRSDSEQESSRMDPEEVVRNILSEFANVGSDLKQVKFVLHKFLKKKKEFIIIKIASFLHIVASAND